VNVRNAIVLKSVLMDFFRVAQFIGLLICSRFIFLRKTICHWFVVDRV
jgi:hypothetical protein